MVALGPGVLQSRGADGSAVAGTGLDQQRRQGRIDVRVDILFDQGLVVRVDAAEGLEVPDTRTPSDVLIGSIFVIVTRK